MGVNEIAFMSVMWNST